MTRNDNDIIVVRDMVKKFGDFIANDHLTFSVKQGEIFGFLGANGAGKTTAMRILCGLSYPTSGYINVGSYDIYTEREKIKRSIGYMSQKFSLYEDLTVLENIKLYAGIYGLGRKIISERAKELLDKLNMYKVRNRLIKEIPLGWKQKIAFSVAVFHNPLIVFLDEPTGGVDPITRRQFWELIHESAENGITVFVTTHYMDEAEYCDRVSIMGDGRIMVIGCPLELRHQHNCKDINELFIKLARG